MMNACDTDACVEGVRQYPEKEAPPFALGDNVSSPHEQRNGVVHKNFGDSSESSIYQPHTKNLEINSKYAEFAAVGCEKDHSKISYSQCSSHSMPPGLAESVMTDETSCCSTFSSPKSDTIQSINDEMRISSSPSISRHASIMSSILSTSSLTSVPLEQSFRTTSVPFIDPHTITPQPDIYSRSIGFSELMKAADNSNMELEVSGPTTKVSDHRSIGRLPPLLENQEAECGALISAAPEHGPNDRGTDKGQSWWQSVPFFGSDSHIANRELNSPLLTTIAGTGSNDAPFEPLQITRLLSNGSHQQQYIKLALERASASVETKIESDDSFEVSLLLGENTRCTVDDVVEVLSNVDLLSLWCNPIESLIVTSNSSEGSSFTMDLDETRMNNVSENRTEYSNCRDGNERTREYEAEWIEATTSSLESPSSYVSFILNMGQIILQSLGCASYGKITMFIERQHSRISLNVGPFNGGISASHSISVSLEGQGHNSGRIRIVDRVRLTCDNEEGTFFLGSLLGCTMGSCLGSCFLPPVVGYVDQVTMSMARLRILLENNGNGRSVSRSS